MTRERQMEALIGKGVDPLAAQRKALQKAIEKDTARLRDGVDLEGNPLSPTKEKELRGNITGFETLLAKVEAEIESLVKDA